MEAESMRTFLRHLLPAKLSSQLLLSFLSLCLIILILCSGILYTSLFKLFQQRSEEAAVSSFKQSEYGFLALKGKMEGIAKSFMLSRDFERFLENADTDRWERFQTRKAVLNKMSETVTNYPFIHSIYLFADDGRALGIDGMEVYALDAVRDTWFYHSGLYRQTQEEYPNLLLSGGYRDADLGRGLSLRNKEGGPYVITASVGVKSLFQRDPSGVLVMTIDESEVYSIYRNLTVAGNSGIAIIDSRGSVISSSRADLREQAAQISLPQGRKYGSFTLKNDRGDWQIIYYRIDGTDWTLLKQIPLSEYRNDIARLQTILLYAVAISSVMAAGLAWVWTKKLTRPFYSLLNAMKQLKHGRLGVTIDKNMAIGNELGILIGEFNRMSAGMEQLMDRIRQIEHAKRETEIAALQAQINPHFLYNTLNMIKWMAIGINAGNIMQSITSLGSLIRPLFASHVAMVPLEEELTYLHHYMSIMNHRYGEGIAYEVDMETGLESLLIPRLLLQPIVENALIHGLEASRYFGTVTITGFRSGNDMVLTVRDNGSGMDEETLAAVRLSLRDDGTDAPSAGSGSIGLINVNRRIKLHFGDAYGLQVDSRPNEGTTVTIRIPGRRVP